MFKSRDMGRAIAVKRWTPTALECYKRGCLELVRTIGAPNVDIPQIID